MARYRWVQDGFVNGVYYNAGDVAATSDAGGLLDDEVVVSLLNEPVTPEPPRESATARAIKRWFERRRNK